MNPHCRIGRVRRKGLDNVVTLGVVTSLDLDPTHVLGGALEKGLQSVVILGYDADGDEFFASSISAGPEILWLMEMLRKRLLEVRGRSG